MGNSIQWDRKHQDASQGDFMGISWGIRQWEKKEFEKKWISIKVLRIQHN